MTEWLVLCYIGETGGDGYSGRNRKVFYSNVGAPMAYEILRCHSQRVAETFKTIAAESKRAELVASDSNVARRLEEIADLFSA
jgi:hypothetical protein